MYRISTAHNREGKVMLYSKNDIIAIASDDKIEDGPRTNSYFTIKKETPHLLV